MAATAKATTRHELVFRQRTCNRGDCLRVFFLCQHCDRGHRYCSDRCRDEARQEQRRAANRRHQQSEEGRLDHRDHQRQYRRRLKEQQSSSRLPPPVGENVAETGSVNGGVTDQGSQTIPLSGNIEPREANQPIRCRLCGRTGRFVNPYPHHFWIERIAPRRRL